MGAMLNRRPPSVHTSLLALLFIQRSYDVCEGKSIKSPPPSLASWIKREREREMRNSVKEREERVLVTNEARDIIRQEVFHGN